MKTLLALVIASAFTMSCRTPTQKPVSAADQHLPTDWKQRIQEYWETSYPSSRTIAAFPSNSPRTEAGTFRNGEGESYVGVYVHHSMIRDLVRGGFSNRTPMKAFFSNRSFIAIVASDTE